MAPRMPNDADWAVAARAVNGLPRLAGDWPRFRRDPASVYCAICRSLPSEHKPWFDFRCPDVFHYHLGEYETTEQAWDRIKREETPA